MEVFVGRIPATLDGAAIEKFTYALVQKECRLTTTAASASAAGVTSKDINKGFYFKRIDTKYENDFGIITFANVKVAQWFISRAQNTDFVWKHNLKVDEARQVPTKAFVKAIERMQRCNNLPRADRSTNAPFNSIWCALVTGQQKTGSAIRKAYLTTTCASALMSKASSRSLTVKALSPSFPGMYERTSKYKRNPSIAFSSTFTTTRSSEASLLLQHARHITSAFHLESS